MVMITKFSRNWKLSHRVGLTFLSFVFIFINLVMIGFLLIEWMGFFKFIF